MVDPAEATAAASQVDCDFARKSTAAGSTISLTKRWNSEHDSRLVAAERFRT